MKTYTYVMQHDQRFQTGNQPQLIPIVATSTRELLALLSAVTVATAFVLLIVWLAGMLTDNLVGAGTWGLGFIFLALATDNRKLIAILQVTTGVTLMGLALLQIMVSPDFTIVSGALLSTWVAFAVFRLLR